MRNAWLLATLLAACAAEDVAAKEVSVGEQRIEIPAPSGYVELTADMQPYYDTMQAYITPSNTRYLALLPEEVAAALLAGEQDEFDRYLNAETAKVISNVDIDPASFMQLADAYRAEVGNNYATVRDKLPDLLAPGDAAVSEMLGSDFAADIGELVPLPVHLDASDRIASSMYLSVGARVGGNATSDAVIAATTLLLHVRDRALFLYVYGAESDLEWTQAMAAEWADLIALANPPGQAGTQDASDGQSRTVVWLALLTLGVLCSVLVLILRRRRERP